MNRCPSLKDNNAFYRTPLIVSRHPAAIEFIRSHALFANAKVAAETSADDVSGRVVAGNIPLHLAAECGILFALEFTGDPPRGREYTVDEMHAAGARLTRYCVERQDGSVPENLIEAWKCY